MPEQNNFLAAIAQISEEKGIAPEKVIETIAAAIAAAYRRDYGKRTQDIRAVFDPTTGRARIFKVMTVVAPEADPERSSETKPLANADAEFALADARKHKPDAAVGEEIFFEVTPTDPRYGRIAAQTAKQVIIQRIREAERQSVYDAFKGKEGELVNGIVQRVEGGNVFLDLGRATGILFPSEQVPTEHYRLNQRLKVFVQNVQMSNRGTDIILSRAHPGILQKLFELEVPEVFAGIVEVVAIAREPGVRSKVAVRSHQSGTDAVGSCIGQRGTRIQTIIAELSGEKIDIIQWADEPARFVANALSPAKVVAVDLREEERKAIVHVNEDQLSLAIGKRGQNVRLAAKLTGWRIDIVKTGEAETVEGTSEATVPTAAPAEQAASASDADAKPLSDVGASPETPASEKPVAEQPTSSPDAGQHPASNVGDAPAEKPGEPVPEPAAEDQPAGSKPSEGGKLSSGPSAPAAPPPVVP